MAKRGKREYNPTRHCGAKTRDSDPCVRGKGERTDHPGQGRCWIHGGRSKVKHCLYSTIQRENIRIMLDRVRRNTADVMDLLPEIELLRALVMDFVEKYDTYSAGIVSWYLSFSDSVKTLMSSNDAGEIKAAILQLRDSVHSRPAQVVDISVASLLIERIGRMTERVFKMKTEGAISVETLKKIMEQMAITVSRHVDFETCAKIEAEWQLIQVNR